MSGASWLHVSQSMQVESTKKSPGTFSGNRCCRLAITQRLYRLDVEFIDEPVQVGSTDTQFLRGSDLISLRLKCANDHLSLQRADRTLKRKMIISALQS